MDVSPFLNKHLVTRMSDKCFIKSIETYICSQVTLVKGKLCSTNSTGNFCPLQACTLQVLKWVPFAHARVLESRYITSDLYHT